MIDVYQERELNLLVKPGITIENNQSVESNIFQRKKNGSTFGRIFLLDISALGFFFRKSGLISR